MLDFLLFTCKSTLCILILLGEKYMWHIISRMVASLLIFFVVSFEPQKFLILQYLNLPNLSYNLQYFCILFQEFFLYSEILEVL